MHLGALVQICMSFVIEAVAKSALSLKKSLIRHLYRTAPPTIRHNLPSLLSKLKVGVGGTSCDTFEPLWLPV
jgi:hypothetical protein